MDPSAIYRTIGTRIARQRTSLALTQSQLGERVGMSRASIANIERGHQTILLHHLYSIADALQLTVQDVIPVAINDGLETHMLMDRGILSDAQAQIVGDAVSRAVKDHSS